MAITDTTAEAPCPIFAGRGISTRGFTLAMPYKTYLTCTPDNIAAERSMLTVFNYDLAEYCYNSGAASGLDGYAFGIYAETGAYTDAITDGKHMYAFKCFLKVTEDYSLGAGERQNCDVRAASIVIEATDSVSGVVHGMYLNTRLKATSGGSVFGGYYLANTATYGGICLELRTEVIGDSTHTTTIGAAAYGYVGLFVAHKSDRQMTGNYAGIVLHVPIESVTIVGTTYGIRFDTDGIWTGTAFDVGISFGANAVKCIDAAGASVFADADITMTTADNALEVIVTSTGALSAGYIQAAQFTVNHSTGALTGTNELHVIALDTALTGGSSRGVPYWYAETIYMSTSANPVPSYVSAISVYIDDLGNAAVDLAILDLGQALGSALTGGTRSCYIRMRRHSTITLKAAIRLEGTSCTNLISIDNPATAPCSAQAGGTLTITHKIAVDMNGTTRYIPVGTIA